MSTALSAPFCRSASAAPATTAGPTPTDHSEPGPYGVGVTTLDLGDSLEPLFDGDADMTTRWFHLEDQRLVADMIAQIQRGPGAATDAARRRSNPCALIDQGPEPFRSIV